MPDLTDKLIKNAEPAKAGTRYVIWDALVPGFGLRVTEGGAKSFIVMRRIKGADKPVRRTLGSYPGLELKDARRMARDFRIDMLGGVDPKAKQEAEREAAKREQEETFAWAYDQFDRRHISTKKARTQPEFRRPFTAWFLPRWKSRPLVSITRRDVSKAIDAIVDEGKGVTANRALTILGVFFNWCIDKGYVAVNPCAKMKPPVEEKSRERVLTDDETRVVWRAAERSGHPFGTLVRLLLLTGQRRNEVAGMQREHVDRDAKLWTIPAALTKANREHAVPLSDAAIALLDAAPNLGTFYVSARGKHGLSDFSKRKVKLDELVSEEAAKLGVAVADWTLHDLRRTVATKLQGLGIGMEVRGAVLNHSPKAALGVTSIYSRHDYTPEKRNALETWARALAAIVDPASAPANLIELRPAG